MRKILVITGSRAEYGILKPVIEAIKKHPKLKLLLLATGMHVSPLFGCTVRDIEKDGFKVDFRVHMLLNGDSKESVVRSLAKGITGMTKIIIAVKPDIVFVCGDRSEPFAAAIVAAYLTIPVAHLFGGDSAIGSNIDDSVRHAITKFSHIHFAATKEHARRIIKLGEDPWRVFITGSPAIDLIMHQKKTQKEQTAKRFGLDLRKPIILAIQHPTGINSENVEKEMRQTLEALVELKHQTILIYPNSDAGSRGMIRVIKKYEKFPFIRTFKSLPSSEYLNLMSIASVMVGNSSSGIIEAPSFCLPVVNIGIRQVGRMKAVNVIDVGYNKKDIKGAIVKALFNKNFRMKIKNCENPYGDGRASGRIVKVLSEIKIDKKLLQKKITY